jgi:hypothetical protein
MTGPTAPERQAAEEQAAQDYADLILNVVPGRLVDWNAINRAIIDRWSMSALLRIKRRAWAIVEQHR